MDFLNKGFAQVSDLFRSMTPGTRITTALLLVVVVVSVGYLFHYQVSGPDLFLMNGVNLPPSHLPAMEAAFAKAGLNSYEIEGTRIRVPRNQRAAYMGALADDNAMPPEWGKSLDGTIAQEGVFVSQEQRQDRLRNAKQKELGLIIRSMKGIENASVLYDTNTKRGFKPQTVNTASVSVKPLGNNELSETQVSAIRHLVAGAIAGMKPENVTVTSLNGGRIYSGGPETADSAIQNAYMKLKEANEDRLKAKVLEALAYVPGVIATVNVELDKERMSRKQSVKHGPKPVTLYMEEKTLSRTSQGEQSGGRAGYTANAPVALASASQSQGTEKSEDESESAQRSVVDEEHSVTDSVGHLPTRVTVVVGIPRSYFESIWRKQNPVAEGEEAKSPDQAALDTIQTAEISKIQKHVAGLLPGVENVSDPTELVTVNPFQDIELAAIPTPGLGENTMAWFGQYWGTLGMLGLVAFSLVTLRSMIGAPSVSPDSEAPADTLSMEMSGEGGEADVIAVAHRLGRLSKGGPSLRDELSEVVKEDPDTAANILRTWIGTPTGKAG